MSHPLRRRAVLTLAVACFAAPPPWAVAETPKIPDPPASVSAAPKHTNRLSREKSPYLLQHAHNPVDWYPWGEEAFAKAKKENKPILLSIGYSTCHWCHVMERESFENEDVAKFLNAHFVAIKLDREERPDVDSIYMTAMQALQLGGGWPLNVFLTPDRKPFYGGTYFPTDRFLALLKKISSVWETGRDGLLKDAENITRELAGIMSGDQAAPADLKEQWILYTAKAIAETFDPKYGGFGAAPKFPSPQAPELILLAGARHRDQSLIDKVLFTCKRMAAGGIYDHLGGGFARYSVDEKWLVPHFEKMLYDNAQLVHLYLDAHLVSGDPRFAAVVRDILRYVLRDMTHADGGFYSAEDADSEGHEGKFYTWTLAELKAVLSEEEARFAIGYFGITENGNFVDHSHPDPLKGQNVLSIVDPDKPLDPAGRKLLETVKQKLLAVRAQRIRPHLDDKILVSWNGLMLGAISRAGIVLDEPAWLAAAGKNVRFVREKLWDAAGKTLYHRFRDGERDSAQLLSAYAFYLGGILEFYQSTLEPEALDFAIAIAEAMVDKFYDSRQGGFFTSPAGSDVLFRAKDDYDGAEPSGNSAATVALLKLAALTDRADFKQQAEKTLKLNAARLEKAGQAMPLMLQAASLLLHEPFRVVIVGDPATPEAQALLKAAHRIYQPEKVVLGTAGKVEPMAKLQIPLGGKPAAYVCTGDACKPPTTKGEKLRELLQFETREK